MVIKIALCLELFRFLQFVVKTGQNFLYAVPNLNFIVLAAGALLSPSLACLRAQPKPPCCVQVTSSSSFVTVCGAGSDIAENADKGMEVCRHGIVRLFVSVILCSSLRSSFEQFLYYGSKALRVVESPQ